MSQSIVTTEKTKTVVTSNKYYATCPYCGRRLCRAVPGSDVDTECPKCNNTVSVQVDMDGTVKAKILV
jgi:predicted nucleic-acid-binding Zn-ribbon protein